MAARAKSALRVVDPGETIVPDKLARAKRTVTSAASDGDRLDLLLAVRSRVAKAVEDLETPARDLAALTRRLLEIAREIEMLEAAEMESGKDGAVEDEAFDASAI
jgi:hypothetical protein